MQAVSVYFVFNCIRSLIYSFWEAVSETFHCKFMLSLSSKSMYNYYLLHEYYNYVY